MVFSKDTLQFFKESKDITLSFEQKEKNSQTVHNAWRKHYHHIKHSLFLGWYQGWDLHPAQIPVRYIATYSYFLEKLDQMTFRLKNFLKSAQGTVSGNTFDDAATGLGLLNYFIRAYQCGAITENEI